MEEGGKKSTMKYFIYSQENMTFSMYLCTFIAAFTTEVLLGKNKLYVMTKNQGRYTQQFIFFVTYKSAQ